MCDDDNILRFKFLCFTLIFFIILSKFELDENIDTSIYRNPEYLIFNYHLNKCESCFDGFLLLK